jgi:hypothetical protein
MTQTTWESNLEHIVKYQLTNHFVTDKQILTELFSKLLSKEKEKWINEVNTYIAQNEGWDSDPNWEQMVVPSKGLRDLLQNKII